jgi:hypothetical protein
MWILFWILAGTHGFDSRSQEFSSREKCEEGMRLIMATQAFKYGEEKLKSLVH